MLGQRPADLATGRGSPASQDLLVKSDTCPGWLRLRRWRGARSCCCSRSTAGAGTLALAQELALPGLARPTAAAFGRDGRLWVVGGVAAEGAGTGRAAPARGCAGRPRGALREKLQVGMFRVFRG